MLWSVMYRLLWWFRWVQFRSSLRQSMFVRQCLLFVCCVSYMLAWCDHIRSRRFFDYFEAGVVHGFLMIHCSSFYFDFLALRLFWNSFSILLYVSIVCWLWIEYFTYLVCCVFYWCNESDLHKRLLFSGCWRQRAIA